MAKGFGAKQSKKGNQKRKKAYIKLIFELLHCPSGRETKILMANQNLIDAGLVKMMGMVAMRLAKNGDREQANFLIGIANWLADELGLSRESVYFPRFLLQMMLAIMAGNANPEAAYPLLQAYLEQDNLFIGRFRSWATAMLYDADPEQAPSFAISLATFGSVILEFPLGDRAMNVEEAIACHQTALQALTPETSPELWADVQDRLGTAYCNRIKGDEAENVENGIAAFEKALQVFTREASPKQWGKTQNNLGLAYRSRIWGDKADNLELAISAHQAALQVRTREAFPKLWAMTQMNLAVDYRHRIKGDREQNLEKAIAACQAALQVYTKEEFPLDWAGTQINLGNIYNHRIRGDQLENLDKAILAHQNALQVFTREDFPQKWAMSQMNLGNVYHQRKQIAEAVNCYRSALEIFTTSNSPQECFTVGFNMGNAAFDAQLWSEAIEGYAVAIEAIEQKFSWSNSAFRRQEILAEAPEIYKRIVKACIKNSQPDLAQQYAERSGSVRLINQLATNNLDSEQIGLDFLLQVLDKIYESQGDPQILYPLLEANIDKLDDSFAQALRQLGKYIQSKVEPEKLTDIFEQLATTEPSLANAEPSLVETIHTTISIDLFNPLILKFHKGNRATNLEIAIAGYEVVASIFTREVFPEQWGVRQIDLGVAYTSRLCGDRKSNLEKAIACYENALQVFTRKSHPKFWGMTQTNLAIAYSKRIQGNRSQNQEKAIEYCQEVLQFCSRDAFPEEWGTAQMNLGIFYRTRVCGKQSENLELAIRCQEAAEQVVTRETFPHDWGNVQNALGLCYLNRIKGDPAENIERAIGYFKAALQVHTREAFPVDWANSQINLGIAYFRRILANNSENLELAIGHYEAALEVATLETMPEEWAMAQINLSGVYSDRIEGNRASNLKASIRCRESALEVYTRRAFPQNWATLQNNLGLTYRSLGQIHRAIDCFEAALEVCTREAFPPDWADTTYNLGLAYRDFGKYEAAIKCFRLSLEIYQSTAFPQECLTTGRSLGNLAFDTESWAEAIEGYALAIEAVEISRSWSTSEFRRQEIFADAIDVYINIVQACINAGQIEKAFEYAERSRSKRLVDLMASNDLYFGGEIPPEVQHYLQQYEDLQRQIDRERSRNNSGNNRELSEVGRDRAAFQAYSEAIATLESQKQQVWEQIRRLDPVLAGEIQVSAPDFEIMQKLIDRPTTAILSFYTTSNDIHIFVLRQNTITLHTATGQGLNELHNWIFQNWLKPYIEEQKTWQSQIGEFLTELSQRLQITELISQQLEGIDELILVPHLALHQIPLAALPIGSDRYLGDKFLIRYTPSCQILQFCQQRGEVENNLTYGTIEDATEDLPFASFEGEQIAQLYNIPDSQRLKGRSQATVSNYRQLAKQVQVLHSSHHAQSRIDQPLESVLKLADGTITLGQLLTPGWRLPQLSDVFLSCCETGLGVTEIADDIFTLSTGFLCAGARSVVSTLWSVDDLATAIFSMFYYQYRQQGKSRAEALQQAQIKLRSLSGNILSNHYKRHLAPLLEAKFKQAESDRKAAQQKRDTYPKDSEAYLQWEQECKERAKLANRIRKAQKHLEEYCQKSFPFSDPVYWAAFICAGLH